MKYEFFHGNTASQTARNVKEAFYSNIITEQTVSNWFEHFVLLILSFTNNQCNRPKIKGDKEELSETVDSA